MPYPIIQTFLDDASIAYVNQQDLLRTEVSALLAENAALKAQAAPTRKLREYKGVTYRDAAWYTPDGKRYEMASGVVWNKSVTLSLTDLDIPALLALRDDPWEKVETLEEVAMQWRCDNSLTNGVNNAELDDLCARLRAAFPCLKAEVSP